MTKASCVPMVTPIKDRVASTIIQENAEAFAKPLAYQCQSRPRDHRPYIQEFAPRLDRGGRGRLDRHQVHECARKGRVREGPGCRAAPHAWAAPPAAPKGLFEKRRSDLRSKPPK